MQFLIVLLLIEVANAQFQCSSGLTTLFNNNQAVTCNPQNPTSCSSMRPGYFCQMAISGNTFICCGIQAQQCGTNSPQIGSNGQPQTCSSDANCLIGYSCSSGTCCPLTNTGTVQIGGSCSDTIQCAGGSSCFNQQCTCPMGTNNNNNGQCVRGSSTVCPNGQVNVNGVCMQQSFLNGQCSFSAQCPANANCFNGICGCNSGYQPINGQCTNSGGGCPSGQVNVNGQCFQQSIAGGQCFFSQQCPSNAQCSGSICACNSGYQNVNGQCTFGGSTNNCPLGQVTVNGQCMSYSSPGAFCVSSVQCLEGAQCSSSMCMCQSGKTALNGYCIAQSSGPCSMTQTFYNNQCYTYSLPGATCTAPTQCVGGSICSNQICQCQSGYTSMYGYCIPSSSNQGCSVGQVLINNQCYNTVPIGSYCMYNEQCQQQATCQNFLCTVGRQTFCPSGQVLINGACYNMMVTGGFCLYSQQCPQGSCQNNVCSGSGNCGSNQVLVNGLCYNQVPIGSSCTFAQQCLGGSTCSNSFCACPVGSQPSNGYCSYNNGTNGNCKSYEVLSNNICYAKMPIGFSCSISMQCPTGASCQNLCICNGGSSFDGNQCSTGITQCQTGLVSVNGQCRALRSIGQSCSFNQECLSFATCQNSLCTCPSGWLPDVNSVCRQQQSSQCGTNAVLIGNQCYQMVQIGSSCQYSQQCLGNSQCNNFICQCMNGNPINGQCQNGGSTQYTCSKPGYYAPLQNNQPINCLYNYCPDQYNSVCEYNYQFQNYMCCTKSATGKKK
ncbi:unnamed protein product, partial [Mesorhabditis belari]|uniref:EGF-like domain-containing protein n=1 Tax=Mesorhabditis belari TaxID=2138241 RepID=A0AAF3E919_9BILA